MFGGWVPLTDGMMVLAGRAAASGARFARRHCLNDTGIRDVRAPALGPAPGADLAARLVARLVARLLLARLCVAIPASPAPKPPSEPLRHRYLIAVVGGREGSSSRRASMATTVSVNQQREFEVNCNSNWIRGGKAHLRAWGLGKPRR